MLPSAGSIPDSYDIYRYLNLVRYSIFDTRYFRRKCNFVYIFRGYLKRLRHKKVHTKNTIFQQKIMRHCGENEIPNFFLENATFFEDPIFFSKILFFLSKIRILSRKSDFFSRKSEFFENIRNSGGVVLCYILLFENIRNPVFGHFPSFPASSFMPRVLPSISDTMWCKAVFILRTP